MQFVILLKYGTQLNSGFHIVGPSDDAVELEEIGKAEKKANRIGDFEIRELKPLSSIRL